jgi:hypothetical protein
MTFGETEPSEQRGGEAVASAIVPGKVTFSRRELDRILGLYGRMVAAGEWRDYAIDFLKDRAVFSVFRRTSEVPLYRIEKNPKLARKRAADPAALRLRRDVDRILHRVAICRARAVRARIGVARHGAFDFSHEVRVSSIEQHAHAPGHFGFIRRIELERGRAMAHRVRIDAGDGGDVGFAGGTDVRRAHALNFLPLVPAKAGTQGP